MPVFVNNSFDVRFFREQLYSKLFVLNWFLLLFHFSVYLSMAYRFNLEAILFCKYWSVITLFSQQPPFLLLDRIFFTTVTFFLLHLFIKFFLRRSPHILQHPQSIFEVAAYSFSKSEIGYYICAVLCVHGLPVLNYIQEDK